MGDELQGKGQGKHPRSRQEVGISVRTRRRREHFHSAEGRACKGPSCSRAGEASWRGGKGPIPKVYKWGPVDPLERGRIPGSVGKVPGRMPVQVPPARGSTGERDNLFL